MPARRGNCISELNRLGVRDIKECSNCGELERICCINTQILLTAAISEWMTNVIWSYNFSRKDKLIAFFVWIPQFFNAYSKLKLSSNQIKYGSLEYHFVNFALKVGEEIEEC